MEARCYNAQCKETSRYQSNLINAVFESNLHKSIHRCVPTNTFPPLQTVSSVCSRYRWKWTQFSSKTRLRTCHGSLLSTKAILIVCSAGTTKDPLSFDQGIACTDSPSLPRDLSPTLRNSIEIATTQVISLSSLALVVYRMPLAP